MAEGREKITLLQPGGVYFDNSGQRRQRSEKRITVWAHRFNQRAGEGVVGLEFTSQVTTRFTVRDQPSIRTMTSDWSLRDSRGTRYGIISVRPTSSRSRRRQIEIAAVTGA